MKAIQATPKSVRDIFSQHQFVIPEFQRPYSWGEEHCDELWDDIANFCEHADREDQYFLGSIVVYSDPATNSRQTWCVVDGQQRLTTLMILIKVLYENASTMEILQRFLLRVNPNTDKIEPDKLRLKSLVQAGVGRDDANDLQTTILGRGEFVNQQNKFKENYEYLKKKVEKLWEEKNPKDREQFISDFVDKVSLLPIECDSENDALDLFQIINDRGLQLDDSDIFKAKIYGAIEVPKNKETFIERWGNINSHEFLFRLFMHISRARRGDTNKEINLRKYILENHLTDRVKLANEWNSILSSLEICHWVKDTKPICREKIEQINITTADEKIYWRILARYTNDYWRYPVFVFLHKHVKGANSDEFYLPDDKQLEYLSLLRDTVCYFYIKGVVYNNVNRVRDTTYKVCAAIEEGRDYRNHYRDNIVENKRNDIDALEQRLNDCEYGRYRTGLVLISSIPDEIDDRIAYSRALEKKIQIEHILPRKWNNYDCWNKESHAQNIDKLGNLIPLERKLNIAASNEFFQRKQEHYANSEIQDALDLSKKVPKQWYPKDVESRHEKVNARLMKFFREPFDR